MLRQLRAMLNESSVCEVAWSVLLSAHSGGKAVSNRAYHSELSDSAGMDHADKG